MDAMTSWSTRAWLTDGSLVALADGGMQSGAALHAGGITASRSTWRRGSSGGRLARRKPTTASATKSTAKTAPRASPGWGLLAIAQGRTVVLWDPRKSSPGPVASVRAEWPKDHHPVRNFPSCVHLDAGVDGNWSGHLLHLPPGTNDRIHLYDIRRLGRPRADGRDRVPLAHDELPLVARIPVGRRLDRHIGAAGGAGVLVASSPAPGRRARFVGTARL